MVLWNGFLSPKTVTQLSDFIETQMGEDESTQGDYHILSSAEN